MKAKYKKFLKHCEIVDPVTAFVLAFFAPVPHKN